MNVSKQLNGGVFFCRVYNLLPPPKPAPEAPIEDKGFVVAKKADFLSSNAVDFAEVAPLAAQLGFTVRLNIFFHNLDGRWSVVSRHRGFQFPKRELLFTPAVLAG